MFRRLIAVALFATLWAVAAPAHASGGALAGVGQVTAFADCPDAFKIPIEGQSTGDGTWTFSLAGAHVACVVTWGNPIVFQGRWDPTNVTCNALTGTGCPRSIDPTRPGFLALGSVPRAWVLTSTSLRFCVGGSCFQGTALVDRGETR